MNGGQGEFDLEVWTDDLLDQLIQVEEEIVSVTQHRHCPPPPPQHSVASTITISHSPPRQFSQKLNDKPAKQYDYFSNAPSISHTHSDVTVSSPINNNATKRQEIDSLKRELGRASKKLTHLEKECLDLKKERDKKEKQLQSVLSRLEANDAKVQCRDNTDLPVHDAIHDAGAFGVNNQEYSAALLECKSKNFSDRLVGCRFNEGANLVPDQPKSLPSCKAIGVQTDKAVDSVDLIIENDLSTNCLLTRKLLCMWNSTSDELTGRNLVSKLFVACETDFHVLFGFLSFNPSSKTTANSLGTYSDVPMPQATQPPHSAEAAKISSLYSVLTKITNGLVELEAMLEVLIDLCRLDNAVIVYRSLHILHIVLNHLSSVKKRSEKRDNVIVEGPVYISKSSQTLGFSFLNNNSLFHGNATETSDAVIKSFDPENVFKKEEPDCCSTLSSTEVDLVSLFELMQQITIRRHEELVRLEAITVMNIILMMSNAYLERQRYVKVVVFHNVSQLLSKESGLRVQKQAVHLVYLLLNCPPIMSMFCSGCKDEMENAGAAISDTRKVSCQQFCKILEGVADCLPCHGDGTLVLQLRRNAIILLAFLVSSGKSGLEILLSHEFSKRTNFLALILKMLVVEMDVEASESIHSCEIFKERTLLIREALIFLNRLVSNAQYSAPVLRVLTNSRDMAFLTIDIANRLSRKSKWLWQPDTVIRNMRESEIASLAQIFKRKVFKFLGYSNASKQN